MSKEVEFKKLTWETLENIEINIDIDKCVFSICSIFCCDRTILTVPGSGSFV